MARSDLFRRGERMLHEMETMFSMAKGSYKEPRPLDDEDFEDFHQAGNARQRRSVSRYASVERCRRQLKKDNPIRYARLRSDLRWARKRLRKMGVDPAILTAVLDE